MDNLIKKIWSRFSSQGWLYFVSDKLTVEKNDTWKSMRYFRSCLYFSSLFQQIQDLNIEMVSSWEPFVF